MIIVPEVKTYQCIEADDLGKFEPPDRENFCFTLRLMVGPKTGEGEESFDVKVCTPKWLESKCISEGFVVGRHYFVVPHYDMTFVLKTLTRLVEHCTGNTWQEVATKVARLGYWEFEDYQDAID